MVSEESLDNNAKTGCEEQNGLQKVHFTTGLSSVRLPCEDSHCTLIFHLAWELEAETKHYFITNICLLVMCHYHRDKRKKENSTSHTEIQIHLLTPRLCVCSYSGHLSIFTLLKKTKPKPNRKQTSKQQQSKQEGNTQPPPKKTPEQTNPKTTT